ncbi:helix-turn-helix transcriptional regulator [Chitinophaga qingshengii]|uniref:Helix-turn-helix transcriptional regulator n=1 Tax=Chitinophaga qingshengii TaxID=1569794 RepID=A0ABR7TFK9_9BACT|nr:AraC family transcriptional regulator [Chitinophaga qingshengii]MBC9929089.1 helix-turn-helix transcriptional regulator [Chitinophaga qingshengii]
MPLQWDDSGNGRPQIDRTQPGINTPQLHEGSAEVSMAFGRGQMSHWMFDGIRMIKSDWEYNNRSQMSWQNEDDVIHLHFIMRGHMVMESLEGKAPLHFTTNTHNMLYNNMAPGIVSNEELNASAFILQFTKETFLQLTEHSDEVLQRFADKVLTGKPGALSDRSLPIDLSMQQTINAILHCGYQGGIKKMFLFSKAIEMLVLQAASYHQYHQRQSSIVRTAYDRDRLHFAREHLLENLENPPTLPALAKLAGLNEYKLKHGFKELFNTTAFGLVAEQRLELARTYLLDHHKTVGEIADMLGYSSIQHFSSAFKKKFGRSPNKAR